MEKQRKRRALGRLYDRSERLFSVLFCLLLNSIVYWGGQHIAAGFHHWDMTTALDRMIPLVPGWVVVYVGAFPFWAVNYVLMARGQDWYRIMTAEVLAKLLCGVVFLAVPTTNVRPELAGNGFGEMLLGLVYEMDAPTNLLPSIHCLESWICFAGLRGASGYSAVVPGIFRCICCFGLHLHADHLPACDRGCDCRCSFGRSAAANREKEALRQAAEMVVYRSGWGAAGRTDKLT